MIRPFLIVAMSGLLLAAGPARENRMPSPPMRQPTRDQYVLQVERINQLAGQIHSMKDAQRLIRLVEEQISDELGPDGVPRKVRKRVAMAEYESATSPAGLVPDERIADAWNWYIGQIGAPKRELVTAKMVYAERDISYTIARSTWRRDPQIWTMPGIFALDAAGKVNPHGATALETLSVVDRFAMEPANIEGARRMARQGMLYSDVVARAEKNPQSVKVLRSVGSSNEPADHNKVDVAVRAYIREQGARQFERVLEGLVYRLFPAPSTAREPSK